MSKEINAATVIFLTGSGLRPEKVLVSLFLQENGDPAGISKAFQAAESEELVRSCHASRFIRANRDVTIGHSDQLLLDSMYKYDVRGQHVHALKLELNPPHRGLLKRYPKGVEPATERKRYNALFQNAEWHAFFIGSVKQFIEKF